MGYTTMTPFVVMSCLGCSLGGHTVTVDAQEKEHKGNGKTNPGKRVPDVNPDQQKDKGNDQQEGGNGPGTEDLKGMVTQSFHLPAKLLLMVNVHLVHPCFFLNKRADGRENEVLWTMVLDFLGGNRGAPRLLAIHFSG